MVRPIPNIGEPVTVFVEPAHDSNPLVPASVEWESPELVCQKQVGPLQVVFHTRTAVAAVCRA
jgi:hypothetical protein